MLFFEKIAVITGVGGFAHLVQDATRVFEKGTSFAWPRNQTGHQGWPTAGQVIDRDLLPALGIERPSRAMFVPATPVLRSDASHRAVVRVRKPFMRNGTVSGQ